MGKCLFKVKDKRTEAVIPVFDIMDDSNGYPEFLINENNSWKWKSAKHFMPVYKRLLYG